MMAPPISTDALTALMLGFFGSAHCIGMCGGIIGSLSLAPQSSKSRLLMIVSGYNIGRITSYALAGALIGILASTLTWFHQSLFVVLRVIAGVLLMVIGAYLAGWWSGITRIENYGQILWQRIQPMASRLVPITGIKESFIAGILWGWLPCGLVYSALGWAASAGTWQGSALLMACFGIGTLPSMFASGVFAGAIARVVQRQWVRVSLGAMVFTYGCWTIIAVLMSDVGMHHG